MFAYIWKMSIKASGVSKLFKKIHKRRAAAQQNRESVTAPQSGLNPLTLPPRPFIQMAIQHSLGDWAFSTVDDSDWPEPITIYHKPTFQTFGWTHSVLDAKRIVSLMAAIDLHPDIKSPRILRLLYDLVFQGVDAGEFDFDTSTEQSDFYAQALKAIGGPTVYYIPAEA